MILGNALEIMCFVVCILIFQGILLVTDAENDAYRPTFVSVTGVSEGKLESGRAELEKAMKFASRSKLPRIGDCWKYALEDLRLSCSELTDETQARLALSFTSCFTEMIGSPNQICDLSTPIKQCLISLDDRAMNTFREYFLHTQDMCYYIQSELWHHETDRAVNELQIAASEMGKTVSEQKTIADSILESQHHSQKVQRSMMKENFQMFEKVLNIKTSIEEFAVQAKEHRVIFVEIFDKIKRMQDLVVWIQGEMNMIDLVAFYGSGFVFCYFLTSSERTHKARVWMMLSMCMGLVVERLMQGYLERNHFTPEETFGYSQVLRQIIAGITLVILLIFAARYRDYQAMNNNLLTDLRKRLDILMTYMEENGKSMHSGNNLVPSINQRGMNQRLQQPPTLLLQLPHQWHSVMGLSESTDVEVRNQNSPNQEDAEDDVEEVVDTDGDENQKKESHTSSPVENDSDESLDVGEQEFGDENATVEHDTDVGNVTGLFQKLTQRLLGLGLPPPLQKTPETDENEISTAAPSPPETSGRYHLRERRNTPNYEPPKQRKEKKTTHHRQTTGYYSSDDDNDI